MRERERERENVELHKIECTRHEPVNEQQIGFGCKMAREGCSTLADEREREVRRLALKREAMTK